MIKLKKDRNRIVETISGKRVSRRNTRWIKDAFYEMNVDCFYINGQWHRINNGKIAYDHENERYDLKENLTYGIVENKDEEITTGYFTKNEIKNVKIFNRDGRTTRIVEKKFGLLPEEARPGSGSSLIGSHIKYIISEEVAHKAGFKESKRFEEFYHEDEDTSLKRSLAQKGMDGVPYDRSIYNTQEHHLYPKVLNYYNNLKLDTSKEAKKIAKLLGGKSFGIEFETSNGFIPYRKLFPLGIIPLRDGSLKGFEYGTIPLSKTKGLVTVKEICKHLNNRCKLDFNCSLHIHIGNIRLDELAIIAYYMLSVQIQDELYELVPPYKSMNEREFGKEKSYCTKLGSLGLERNKLMNLKLKDKKEYKQELNKNFDKIFQFLTEGMSMNSEFNRQTGAHPIRGNKWNRQARYTGINLMPAIFSENGTIEFRMHQGTLNYIKTINWLLITTAIVRYAENNITSIVKNENHSLSDVIKGYSYNFVNKNNFNEKGEFLSEYLLSYIEERKNAFKEAKRNDDLKGDKDMKRDSEYSFNYKGIVDLF